MDFGAEDAERLTPFKDDKPKYAEIMPFQAGSDYFSSARQERIANLFLKTVSQYLF